MTPASFAAELDDALAGAPPTTDAQRAVRRRFSARCRGEEGAFVLAAARALLEAYDRLWIACELVRLHRAAFAACGPHVEAFARGLDSWGSVDAFGRILAGPAWLRGLIGDDLVARWAASPDRWLRRAALVATVALNVRVDGGRGDALRTLAVCRALAGDRDDIVVKAMSWALRELAVREPAAVLAFLDEQDLAPRARREVSHKIATGLKRPRRRATP